jgi:hypothetical protein
MENGKQVNYIVYTGTDGIYTFENLPSYEVTFNAQGRGKVNPAGYRIFADSIPNGYGVTILKRGQENGNDLSADNLCLLDDNSYVILVNQAISGERGNNASSTTSIGATAYDPAETTNVITDGGHDMGFEYGKSTITGIIWEDENFDGILNYNLTEDPEGYEEHGIDGVTVNLEVYKLVGGIWVADTENTAGVVTSTVTAHSGVYTFINLPTYYLDNEGKAGLYGYKLQVDLSTVEEGLKVTKYMVAGNDNSIVDNHIDKSTDGYMTPDCLITSTAINDQDAGLYESRFLEEYNGTTYDVLTPVSYDQYHGGFIRDKLQSISGFVWNDANYDGLYNEEELPMSGSVIKLIRYLSKDGEAYVPENPATPTDPTEHETEEQEQTEPNTGSMISSMRNVFDGEPTDPTDPADPTDPTEPTDPAEPSEPEEPEELDPFTTTTDEDGKFIFNDLPTHTYIDGELYIYGYRLEIDIPDGYAATKFHVTEPDEENGIIVSDIRVLANGAFFNGEDEYIVLLDELSDDAIDNVYSANSDKEYLRGHYDVRNPVSRSGYNGGLVEFGKGSISGIIWTDTNYNGIRETDGNNAIEYGIQGIEVFLSSYYYKNGEWVQYSEGEISTLTNDNGEYLFDNLDTGAVIDGERMLLGYKLRVSAIPDGMAVTRYKATYDTDVDSQLIAVGLLLTEESEHIVLAKPVTIADIRNEAYIRSDGANEYDLVAALDVKNIDGGIKEQETGAIMGTAWIDASRNGVLDSVEKRLNGIKLELTQFYFDGMAWRETGTVRTTVTKADGEFRFTGLPISITVDDVTYLTGYKLKASNLPDGATITTYYANGGERDNKLNKNTMSLDDPRVQMNGYIIVAAKAQTGVSESYIRNGFDLVKGVTVDDMNIGVWFEEEEIIVIPTGDNTDVTFVAWVTLSAWLTIVAMRKRKAYEERNARSS